MKKQPSNTGSGGIFKNKFLESLTRTHIALPLGVYPTVSLSLLYVGITQFDVGGGYTVLFFVLGLLTFTLVEYLLHRFLFHMDESTPKRAKFVYTIHGVHHDYPKDKDRLALPVPVSVTLSTLFFLFYQLMMGDFVYSFFPGFLLGYSSYIGIHYMVHAFQPPKNFFKFLWIHHGVHHYKQPQRAFGVSSPLWDVIFRTMPKSKKW